MHLSGKCKENIYGLGIHLEHSQAGQELSNIFRISVFSILNTLKNCAKLYQCASIAQNKRWHCADIAQYCAKEKLFFFGEMGLLRRRKPGAIQAQNTIAPYFNKLINIIKKQLFIPNKKIIIKIS